MKTFARAVAALTLFALAACDQAAAPGGTAPTGGNANNSVALQSTRDLPDWLLIARQRDCSRADCLGEVLFNQRTITRNPDGTADIWIQVRHGNPQAYPIETATSRTTITYTVERAHYRFKCVANQFLIAERQIIGSGDTVVAHDTPRPIWRAPVEGSLVPVIMPIACNGH